MTTLEMFKFWLIKDMLPLGIGLMIIVIALAYAMIHVFIIRPLWRALRQTACIDALEIQNTRLRVVLRRYVKHDPPCIFWNDPLSGNCDCSLKKEGSGI